MSLELLGRPLGSGVKYNLSFYFQNGSYFSLFLLGNLQFTPTIKFYAWLQAFPSITHTLIQEVPKDKSGINTRRMNIQGESAKNPL